MEATSCWMALQRTGGWTRRAADLALLKEPGHVPGSDHLVALLAAKSRTAGRRPLLVITGKRHRSETDTFHKTKVGKAFARMVAREQELDHRHRMDVARSNAMKEDLYQNKKEHDYRLVFKTAEGHLGQYQEAVTTSKGRELELVPIAEMLEEMGKSNYKSETDMMMALESCEQMLVDFAPVTWKTPEEEWMDNHPLEGEKSIGGQKRNGNTKLS
ncbi:hypothetical protein SELMODRAFT_410761 [Selaginella moellendorffii]|uniref:Uncharacterized protein n=1 Tax=Selaginella moellendorffii TaxID=88036 RepID=D8RFS6_SELML|nr:hypothetical protein SELMODRAFT_410761 [Selaginella moellendorffii]